MAPRLPAAQKARRDEQIVRDRAGGLQWSTIAQKYDLSEQHARQIWKQRLAAEPLEPLDGRDTITEALLQTEARIEELALLAESTNNDAIKLGAIRARGEAMSDRHDLLRLAGLMPISWVAAHTEADIRRMGENIIAVLEKHGVFADVVDDLLEALRRPGVRSNGHKQ